MTLHAMKEDEVRLLRDEIELLMNERRQLLQVTGAAAVFVANLDTDTLPDEADTIDAAEMLAEQLNPNLSWPLCRCPAPLQSGALRWWPG